MTDKEVRLCDKFKRFFYHLPKASVPHDLGFQHTTFFQVSFFPGHTFTLERKFSDSSQNRNVLVSIHVAVYTRSDEPDGKSSRFRAVSVNFVGTSYPETFES